MIKIKDIVNRLLKCNQDHYIYFYGQITDHSGRYPYKVLWNRKVILLGPDDNKKKKYFIDDISGVISDKD